MSIMVDFRVKPSHIIDINAYMLIFNNKITKIPEKINFQKFRIFWSGIVQNFRVIGAVVSEKQGGSNRPPGQIFCPKYLDK